MKNHWMIYVKWNTIVKWKRNMDHRSEPGQQNYPYQYASDGPRFRNIQVGDVLWVVTNPRFGKKGQPVIHGRSIPAAVMARLRVRSVCCQSKDTSKVCGKKLPNCANLHDLKVHQASGKAVGDILIVGEEDVEDAGSLGVTYPPLYNIFGILDRLEFQNGKVSPNLSAYLSWVKGGNYWKKGAPVPEKRNPGPHWKLGQYLQSLRKLTLAAGSVLDDHHTSAVKGRRVFLSYRHADVKALAEAASPRRRMEQWMGELEKELEDEGFVSWLDKHQILDKGTNIGLLDQTLRDGVHQAALFVALITPSYGVSEKRRGRSWTLEEWEFAGRQVNKPNRRDQLIRIGLVCGGEADKLPKEATDRFVETVETPQTIAKTLAAVAREIS